MRPLDPLPFGALRPKPPTPYRLRPYLLHLEGLRPPKPLDLGGCAPNPLRLDAAPSNPCNSFAP